MTKQPDRGSAAAPRVRLSMLLKQAREDTSMTQQQVADELEWSLSKVIRIESGAVKISVTDLRAALGLFDITEKDRVEELLALSRQAREKEWWDAFRKDAEQVVIDLTAYEASAEVIHQYQAMVIPGLLQTQDYARRVIGFVDKHDPSKAEALLKLRLDRQKNALKDDGRERVFIIDESALHRTIVEPRKMLAQFERLKEVNRLPGTSIHVLPFTSGPHRGLAGSFQAFGIRSDHKSALSYVVLMWDPLESTCRHASLSIL